MTCPNCTCPACVSRETTPRGVATGGTGDTATSRRASAPCRSRCGDGHRSYLSSRTLRTGRVQAGRRPLRDSLPSEPHQCPRRGTARARWRRSPGVLRTLSSGGAHLGDPVLCGRPRASPSCPASPRARGETPVRTRHTGYAAPARRASSASGSPRSSRTYCNVVPSPCPWVYSLGRARTVSAVSGRFASTIP